MFEHCWLIVLRGKMLRGLGAVLRRDPVARRLLRYGSGILHVVLLATSLALYSHGWFYAVVLAGQLGLLAAAAVGVGIARYYTLVTSATLMALFNYLRRGVPATWEPRGGHSRLNRALDVAIAGTGLVVSSPFLAAAALAVKLQDGSPVLYRQDRVGRDEVDFELLKLAHDDRRRREAGSRLCGRQGRRADHAHRAPAPAGSAWTSSPRFWNVVRGEMSVIGPRPTLRYQVDQYDERQLHRLDVKPGITGWAQIHGRAALPWADRIELDLWYVRHHDWKTDLLILVRTPLALGGAYKVPRAAGSRRVRPGSTRESPGAVAELSYGPECSRWYDLRAPSCCQSSYPSTTSRSRSERRPSA